MRFYEPLQHLSIFHYNTNGLLVYLNSTINVLLNKDETLDNAFVSKVGPDVTIMYKVITDESQEVKYIISRQVPCYLISNVTLGSTSTPDKINEVREEHIKVDLGEYKTDVYKVTVKIYKEGNLEGQVTTTISENSDIEID